jgi:hypothetical protein
VQPQVRENLQNPTIGHKGGEKQARGGGERETRHALSEGKRGNLGGTEADETLALLSDDDFDFHFVKAPLKENPERVSKQSRHNQDEVQRDFPMNHYELLHQEMFQKNQQECDPEDPWDRALLPKGVGAPAPGRRETGGLVAAGEKPSIHAKGSKPAVGKESGIKKISCSIAPFFGGVSIAAGGEKPKKLEREPNKCSICHKPGHCKRKCPVAGQGEGGAQGSPDGGEDKAGSKRRKAESEESVAEPQSAQEKLENLSSVSTNAGMLDGVAGLEALFQRLTACSCVVFGLLYQNNDSNLRRTARKGNNVNPPPLGCCLLMTDYTDEEDERAGNVFVPFLQAPGAGMSRLGTRINIPITHLPCCLALLAHRVPRAVADFTTTIDQRRDFMQKVFSPANACPLVCFHARSCLLDMSPFVEFGPETFCQAQVRCLHIMQWLLDPEFDPSSLHFDHIVEKQLGISPFSVEMTEGGASNDGQDGKKGVHGQYNLLDVTFARVLFQDMGLCAQMWDLFSQQLQELGMEGAASLEMSVIPILCLMEEEGIGFSTTRLMKERRAMERKLIQLEEEATKLLGHPVMLTSPQQLCSVLFEELKLPPPANGLSSSTAAASTSKFKGANQQYSTNEEVLTALTDHHPLPAIVLEHRCVCL